MAAPASAAVIPAAETRDILAEFVAYREAEDMASAVRTYGEMADWLFERAVREPGWDPCKRSIVSSFMPKSGGTYTFNRLKSCGYVEYFWGITHRKAHRFVYPVPRALANYLQGGMACHTHFLPTADTMHMLDAAGVDRVWVHLRDPRETVASSYYHNLGIGQGSGTIGEERARQARDQAARNGVDVELGNAEKANAFFRLRIGVMVDWAAQWLELAVARPGYVVFSTFAEMRDPRAMLERVFTEFGMTIEVPELPTSLPEDRRRTEHSHDWREGLTDDTLALVNETVQSRLDRFELTSALL